jgi:ubiquinone/menaquinone biosynthesis C-methylase UbiE
MLDPPTDPTRYWNRNAGRYDRSMWLFGGPLPRAIALTAEAVTGAGAVLELAAGTGLFTGALSQVGGRVTATDFAPAMLDRLRARAAAAGWTNVTVEAADAGALPYPDAAFDAVVAANVLHVLPALDAVFPSVMRVLRPGGVFVTPTYCHDESFSARVTAGLLRRLTGFPGRRRFTVASLAQTLADAGYRVERVERVPGLMPIGFVAARHA